ncbi:hypothetical protein HQ520_17670 [bacterium]|nr:hypothetical protein [bacterium]
MRALLVIALLWLVCSNQSARGEEFLAGYQVSEKYLLLTEQMEGAPGRLKDFSDLDPREISTIYHEMWHAWFSECQATTHSLSPEGGLVYQTFRKRADAAHGESPPEKRLEIHEEAAADFIDAVVETYVRIKRHLVTKTPEEREEIRHNAHYMSIYGQLFGEPYTGYYTKAIRVEGMPGLSDQITTSPIEAEPEDGLLLKGTLAGIPFRVYEAERVMRPFMEGAEDFGLPARYIEEATAKLAGIVFFGVPTMPTGVSLATPQAEVIWSDTPLGEEDLRVVTEEVFEGRLPSDPKKAFAEEGFAGPAPRRP